MHDNAFAYSTLNESIECMRRTKKDTQFTQFIYNANHSLRVPTECMRGARNNLIISPYLHIGKCTTAFGDESDRKKCSFASVYANDLHTHPRRDANVMTVPRAGTVKQRIPRQTATLNSC